MSFPLFLVNLDSFPICSIVISRTQTDKSMMFSHAPIRPTSFPRGLYVLVFYVVYTMKYATPLYFRIKGWIILYKVVRRQETEGLFRYPKPLQSRCWSCNPGKDIQVVRNWRSTMLLSSQILETTLRQIGKEPKMTRNKGKLTKISDFLLITPPRERKWSGVKTEKHDTLVCSDP